METGEQRRERFSRFAHFAIGLGGVVPCGIFFTLQSNNPYLIAGPKLWFMIGGFLVFLSYIATICVEYIRTHWVQETFLFTAAVASMISLNLLVFSTGGPTLSVFAFHYLYIPVVVGIAFDKTAFLTAAGVSWLSYLANLYCVRYALPAAIVWNEAVNVSEKDLYLALYCVIFSIQIIMTAVMYFVGHPRSTPQDGIFPKP